MTPRRHALAIALCTAAIVASANLTMATFGRGARLDLSENRLYTMGPGVTQALGALAEPVALSYVFSRAASRDFPELEAHGLRVREFLREAAASSNGMVRLEEIDPAPFSADEATALAVGLTPLARGPRGPIFIGIIGVNAVDERRLAPALAPERASLLERDFVGLLAALETARLPQAAAESIPPRSIGAPMAAFEPEADAPAARRAALSRLAAIEAAFTAGAADAALREEAKRVRARLAVSEAARAARLTTARRNLFLLHALAVPVVILGIGLGVRRFRMRLGGAAP